MRLVLNDLTCTAKKPSRSKSRKTISPLDLESTALEFPNLQMLQFETFGHCPHLGRRSGKASAAPLLTSWTLQHEGPLSLDGFSISTHRCSFDVHGFKFHTIRYYFNEFILLRHDGPSYTFARPSWRFRFADRASSDLHEFFVWKRDLHQPMEGILRFSLFLNADLHEPFIEPSKPSSKPSWDLHTTADLQLVSFRK